MVQNKILWLLISILLVFLLFSKNGLQMLKNLINNASTSTSSSSSSSSSTPETIPKYDSNKGGSDLSGGYDVNNGTMTASYTPKTYTTVIRA